MMTSRRRQARGDRRAHPAAVAVLLACLPVPLANCSSGTDPQPMKVAEGRIPDPRAIDRQDATAVSHAAVLTIWTSDAATDQSQEDAYRRAAPYLTSQYASTTASLPPTGSIPAAWRRHHAFALVTLTPQQPDSGAGPDTSITAHRQWGITIVGAGRDGWTGTAEHTIAFVTLQRPNSLAPWQISSLITA